MTVTVGYQVHNNENIALSLRNARDNGYVNFYTFQLRSFISIFTFILYTLNSFDYIVTPLVHPRSKKFVPFSDVFFDANGTQFEFSLY